MNEPKRTDFFPEINENYTNLVAPNIYEAYQDTAEDRQQDERLAEIEAEINEKDDTFSGGNLGELPFDESADQQRWSELEGGSTSAGRSRPS